MDDQDDKSGLHFSHIPFPPESDETTGRRPPHGAGGEAPELYLRLFDEFPCPLWRSGADAGCAYVNQAWLSFTGRTMEQELGEGWTEGIHPEDLERCLTTHSEAFNSRQAFEIEYRLRHSRGEYRWVNDVGKPFYDLNGDFAGYIGACFDISNRKRAEESAREAQARTESVLASVADVHIVFDRQWRFLYVNEAALRAIARPRLEILGRTLWDLHPDIVGTELGRQYQRAMNERIPVAFDFHYSTNDTWWENHFYPAPEGLAVFATNITERKRAEERLREYEKVVGSLEEMIAVVDREYRYLIANSAFLNYRGLEREQVVGHLVSEILDQEIFEKIVKQKLDECFQGRVVKYELRNTYPKLGERDLLISYFPIEGPGGIGQAACILLDITERKRAEEAIRESEERYRELFENSKDAIFVHDLRGFYTSVNRAGEKLSGYSREEIIGKHFADLVPPEEMNRISATLRKKLDEAGETVYEVDMIAKDGRRVPVESSSRVIYENGVAVAIQGTARDITDRRRAEEERGRAHKASKIFSRRLIEAQEAERRRISRELHDQIGQVLTAVKINLHTLQRKCAAPDTLSCIEDNLNVIDEAFEQVRNLSADLRPLLLDDFGLVVALRWYLKRQTQATGVHAEFGSFSLGENKRFSSELETACFRIAQEAVTNIIRHANAKRISVRLEKKGPDLVLSIKDDGLGFDVRALRNSTAGAATLGIRGMEERAQAVGGTMTINSAPVKGTEICARFPMTPEESQAPKSSKTDKRKHTVIV